SARPPPSTCSTPSRCSCSVTGPASWRRSPRCSAGRSPSGGSGSTGGPGCSTPGRYADCSPRPSAGRWHPMADQRNGPLPDHVTTPLLTLITEHSLDDDYREVAERGGVVAGTAPRGKPAWIAATVVGVFGILVATAAVQTSRNADTADAGRATLIARVQDERAALEEQQAAIADLQRANIG